MFSRHHTRKYFILEYLYVQRRRKKKNKLKIEYQPVVKTELELFDEELNSRIACRKEQELLNNNMFNEI